jgi:hypothetical protein
MSIGNRIVEKLVKKNKNIKKLKFLLQRDFCCVIINFVGAAK